MTEPETSPSRSLIQQRIALERTRIIMLGLAILTLLSSSLAIGLAVPNGGQGFALLSLLAPCWLVYQFVRAHRALRAFEQEHGRDAGRQHPVGR
jgi:hypothetical protein